MQSSSRTVFLNPNFRNTHINPNFLISKPSSSIHINPEFLQKLHSSETAASSTQTKGARTNEPMAKVIAKSRTKIVREPTRVASLPISSIPTKSPMIKIGRNKLIRATVIVSKNRMITPTKSKLLAVSKRRPPVVNEKYKIDRRAPNLTNSTKLARRQSFESKYALRRSSMSENLLSKKLVVTKRKLLKIGSPNKGKFHISSPNKKLELLNINGVLYRSTKNKLQKAVSSCQSAADAPKMAPSTGRSVFIKGDKFVLDKSGKSLTRVELSAENMKLKRIDIGGLTYVAKSNNVFVRTNIHKTRNHLNLAKQKSINTLSKNLVKTNIPCPIYRKVGKCAAFDRGKCPKVHDSKQISICQKFLKGECSNVKCLLSHDVNLSKMPTCKFYLQGICVRENCPYLHKKLAENAEICLEFLRGFCQLADKCNKRHEFVCPNFEKTGKCDKVKCEYCAKRKKVIEENVLKENHKAKQKEKLGKEEMETDGKSSTSRYFVDECNVKKSHYLKEQKVIDVQGDHTDESTCILKRRPKLGELPAFIPL